MTIPGLYALLERLAANADEQKRFRDAAEIRDGMKCLSTVANGLAVFRSVERFNDGSATSNEGERIASDAEDVIGVALGNWPNDTTGPRRGGILR